VFALVAAAAACGTETTTLLGPSPERCGITLPSSSATIAAAGGVVTFNVSTEPECEWSVSTDASWLTQITPPSRQGAGQVELRAASNAGPARTGTVRVADRTFTVVQAGGCAYVLQPTSHLASAAGGPAAVSVTTAAGCAWVAIPHADLAQWVTITSGESGVGSGTVTLAVQAHTGPQRSGTLTIAGRLFTVTQESGCTYSISPPFETIAAAGGSGEIAVTTGPGCPWAASSPDAWITVETQTGTGPGEVRYNVAPHTGLFGRIGSVQVAGDQFEVIQFPF
jgi:hypothetical protein